MTCWSEERFPLLSHTATDLDENPCARYMVCSSRDALLTGAAKIFLQQYNTAPCLDENRVQATYEFQNLQHHTAAATTTTTLPKKVFHFGLAEPLLLPFYYFAQLKLLLTRLQAICFLLLSFQFCYTNQTLHVVRVLLVPSFSELIGASFDFCSEPCLPILQRWHARTCSLSTCIVHAPSACMVTVLA